MESSSSYPSHKSDLCASLVQEPNDQISECQLQLNTACSSLYLKVFEVNFHSSKNLMPELSFALKESNTSEEIYRSPIILASELPNLPPVPIKQGLFNSLSLSFYKKTQNGLKSLNSATIELGENFPLEINLDILRTSLKALDVKIKITKEEMQLPEIGTEIPDTAEAVALREQLKKGLSEYNLSSPGELENAIEETKKSINLNQNSLNYPNIERENYKLKDLEQLLSIHNQILSLNQEKSIMQKKIDLLEAMLSDIKSMPHCPERSLRSILVYAYYKSYELNPESCYHRRIEIIDPDKEFNNFLGFLIESREEDLPKKFQRYYKNQKWKKLIKETEKILKEYQPINMKELECLIKKSTQNSDDLENKDIILLLGATGSGKSTTAHFLCGSEMERVEENGVNHIKATYIKNPILNNTIISHHSQSETKYITMIPINLNDSGKTVFLCDTPGLIDTKGPEIDIANTISIVKCLKNCRSVRPLILISSKAQGDRFEGVKKLAQTLARFITNFIKYKESFTYAFTKYDKIDANNIHGLVKDAIEEIENPDKVLLLILKDIKHKTKNETLTINPLKDDPQQILRKIMEKDPIINPKGVFERFITEDSRLSLKNQVMINQKAIEKALNSKDYEMVMYKLDELQYIGSLFTEFRSQYNQCIKSVAKTTKDLFKGTVSQLNSALDNNGTLDSNTAENYKKVYNDLKILEKAREKHLKPEELFSGEMLSNIVSRLSLSHSDFKFDDADDYILSNQLKNGKILSESFEELAPLYKNVCNIYTNYIEKLISSANIEWEKSNFEDFAKYFVQVKRFLRITEHLNLDNLNDELNKLKDKFIENLKERCNSSLIPLKKEFIEKSDMEMLKANFLVIKSVSSIHSLLEIISENEKNDLLSPILEEYKSHFERSKAFVLLIINNIATRNFAEIESKLQEFKLLMEVPDIEYHIASSYQDVLSAMINKINFYKGEAKDIIRSFINSPESADFGSLRDCLACLESGKWIEKFREGIYSNELSSVEKEINIFIQKLYNELKSMDLGYESPDNVPKAYSIVKKIEEIVQLKEFIPSLENFDEIALKTFKERANEAVKLIQRELNLGGEIVEKEKNEFERLECIRSIISSMEEKKENTDELCVKLKQNNIYIDKIENSFKYIQACKNLLPDWASKLDENILSSLAKFYKESIDSLNKSVSSIDEGLLDERGADYIEPIKHSSFHIVSQFKFISLLSEKSPSFFSYLNLQESFEQCKTKVYNLSSILSDKLNICTERNQLQSMSMLLAITNEFARINENFSALSEKYENIHRLKVDQACKNILESIERHRFDEARQLIQSLDGASWNEYENIIKQKSYIIIENILNDTKDNVLNINNFQLDYAHIYKTISNFNNIVNVRENIYNLFEEEKIKKYKDTENEISQIFDTKIMNFINSIRISILSFNFCEAEKKMQNIKEMNELLKKNTVEDIKILQNELFSLLEKITIDIEKYEINNIKDFSQILNIEEAAKDYPAYKCYLKRIKDSIHEKLNNIKDTYPNLNDPEKKSIINDLSSVLGVLPDDIKNEIENWINEMKKKNKNEKEELRKRIECLWKNQNIEGLCNIYRDLEKKKSSDSQCVENKLRDILSLIRNEINMTLYNKDWNSALNKSLILTMKDEVERITKDSETIFSEILLNLNQFLEKFLNTILHISDISNCAEFIEAFKFYEAFIGVNIKFERKDKFDFFWAKEKLKDVLSTIKNYFITLMRKYDEEAKTSKNMSKAGLILNRIKEWDNFFKIFKIYLLQHQNLITSAANREFLGLNDYSAYANCLYEEFNKAIEAIKGIQIEFDEIKHPSLLQNCANNINERWLQLKKFEGVKEHLISINFEEKVNSSLNLIFKKIKYISYRALHLIQKEDTNEIEFKEIQVYFNALIVFQQTLEIRNYIWDSVILEIRDKIFSRISELRKIVASSSKISDIVESMINMKRISNNFTHLKPDLEEMIDKTLKTLNKKTKAELREITGELERHSSGLGLEIISEQKFFEGVMQRLWMIKTQDHGIEYALNMIEGDNINKEELEKKYKIYTKEFNKIRSKYWKNSQNNGLSSAINGLASDIKIVSEITTGGILDPDISLFKDSYPKLLAYVVMLLVLLNIKKYKQDVNDEDQLASNFTPHPIQVLSIFRMLGIGYTINSNPRNNLVQILTGEGKSVALALICAILGLLGYDVYCACYSSYLSKRDYDYFQDLYSALGINTYIRYGTFSKLCWNYLNSRGDINQIILDFIESQKCPMIKDEQITKPKILLIDEVDVFFSKSFYGNTINPVSFLKNPTIKELTDYIWKNREALTFGELVKTLEYQNCYQAFPEFGFIVEQAARKMLNDANSLINHKYIVSHDKICYKEHDGLSFNTSFGYSTLFAYYKEYEQGSITKKSLESYINITVNFGNFSYAEIPLKFNYIMGVTGTLKNLKNYEKNIIENEYDIKFNTYMPSVYGKNNRTFGKERDVHVENKYDYHLKIITEINKQIAGKNGAKRAVFVFFEDEDKLMNFFNEPGFKDSEYEIQLVTEKVNKLDRAMLIKRATLPNAVTLLTKAFGRGTDFKCLNQEVQNNGGVHVIQTFFAESKSEETQIMGRTARQGQEGSYSIILLDTDLKKFSITEEEIEIMRNRDSFYDSINQKRDEFNRNQTQLESDEVKRAKVKHERSMEFLDFIEYNDKLGAIEFLQDMNGFRTKAKVSKTIILMNAMPKLLDCAKDIIGIVLLRSKDVLLSLKLNSECFELQFCIYRDFNFEENKTLQKTPWTNRQEVLENFFIKNASNDNNFTQGAIELGLWHINSVIKYDKFSQVILLNDSSQALENDAEKLCLKPSLLKIAKFRNLETAQKELEKFIPNRIPIHVVYNNPNEKIMNEIAQSTEGVSRIVDFNVRSSEGIIEFICTSILMKAAGNVAVNRYYEKFPFPH